MNPTKIGWCDRTWNPVVGCTMGCEYCYARRQAKRFKHRCRKCYDFMPHLHEERLDELLAWRPLGQRRVFVCSMGELFDPGLSAATTRRILALCYQQRRAGMGPQSTCHPDDHTFKILTKRPDLAKEYDFPPNLWLGVSVENQEAADLRIPQLLKCNAALRFVSYEPAHGDVDFGDVIYHKCRTRCKRRTCYDDGELCGDTSAIDWLIIGAETGNRKGKVIPKREWIQSAIDQARAAGVPVFVKRKVVELFPEFAGIEEFPN